MIENGPQLRITEIFHSIQGEALQVGLPTVFVRLTGCPLRCQYCDTAYAFSGGERWSLDAVLGKVSAFNCKHVCITGGEPLAQRAAWPLLESLCDLGHEVSLETSGAISLAGLDPRVVVVMDLKTPDSGEERRNLFSNLALLRPKDQVKFVLCSRRDYDWAKDLIHEHHLAERTQLLFSASWNQLDLTSLAEWILEDKLPVRLQIQLHKILWPDTPGR